MTFRYPFVQCSIGVDEVVAPANPPTPTMNKSESIIVNLSAF
ncbi:hypothetical protein L911_1083 [Vibrio fluvialis I21563]|nr:hypothetical protein L911_1083 [Vibrio fluvialis I21563]